MPSTTTPKKFIKPILTAFALASAFSLSAQISGVNAFLQGQYVEVGLNRCGAYGSGAIPSDPGPLGPYHPNPGLPGLGFVADSDEDGWTSGSPAYCGDYFVPGSPVEGFAVTKGMGTLDPLTNTDQSCGSFEIPGSVISYSDGGAIRSAVWEGVATWPTGETVRITQTTVQPVGKLYFVTQLTFCNIGTLGVTDFYYCRNVDPDNDQPWSGDFTTFNEIVSQPPTDPEALVTAEGLTFGCFLGLGARDEMARVSFGNFGTGDPYDVWNAVGGYSGSGSNTADEAISIAYKVPLLAPGECKCFAFAYILNEADLAEALDATATVGILADGIDISSTGTTIVCNSDSVRLQLLGDDDYEWTWTPTVGLSSDTGRVVFAYPDTTTTYTATGTGSFCGDAIRTVTIFVDNDAFADAGEDKFICPGDPVMLDGSGGVAYVWEPALGLSDPNVATPIANPSVTRTYSFTTTTINGCEATDEVTVTVYPLPNVSVSNDVVICEGDETLLSGSGALTYEWSPPSGLVSTSGEDVTASPGSTTNYIVVGTDANGCSSSAEVEVFVNPLPDVTASTSATTIDIIIDERATLTALPAGGLSYSWSPLDGILSDPNSFTVEVQPADTTTYIVTVTDANGCVNIDSVTVNVIGDYEVYLPTAFSPNGDGVNDTYRPYIIGISAQRLLIDFSVYNRWGELVFVSTDQFDGWDGTIGGTDQEIGTYVVVVRSLVFGESVINRTTFQLVR
jgi:gliding motility-associated-like protein